MHLSNRQGAIAYNIGSAFSYVSLVMLLMDAVHVAKQHDPVTWARFGFVRVSSLEPSLKLHASGTASGCA